MKINKYNPACVSTMKAAGSRENEIIGVSNNNENNQRNNRNNQREKGMK